MNYKNLLVLVTLLIPCIAFSQGTETRKISSFSSISAAGSFDTYVESGIEESVRIEAEGIDPKKIITELKGNLLKVYLEKGNYKNIRTKVYITCKKLEGLERSGSGNLNCKANLAAPSVNISSSGSGDIAIHGKVKAQDLDVAISGSGNAILGFLEADELDLSISGSGDVEVSSGAVKKQSLSISGSGNINAFGLTSAICSASISGSGNVEVTANKVIEGAVSGSGDIEYKGNAQVTNSKFSGSGRIRKVD